MRVEGFLAVRFSYIEREVDPMPGIPGSDREWEPQIPVRVGGVTSIQIVPGLVDTGASVTLIPLRYLERLGVETLGIITLSTGGGPIRARLARCRPGITHATSNPRLVSTRRLRRAARSSSVGADGLPRAFPRDVQHTTTPPDLASQRQLPTPASSRTVAPTTSISYLGNWLTSM